jgi:hypothetical protein
MTLLRSINSSIGMDESLAQVDIGNSSAHKHSDISGRI